MVKTKAIKPKEKRTIVSNKKKDRDQFKKEMDMIRLKEKINEIMKKVSNDKSKIENNNLKYKKNIDLLNEKYTDNSNILYQSMFQKYMKEEFTLICVSFINKIIMDIKRNHLEQYEGKYNFNKILISLAKDLLLNQFELILLSLYLEYINISLYLDNYSLEDCLLFLCYFIKELTIDKNELEPIKFYLYEKYNNFKDKYKDWFRIIEKKINNKLNFSYFEINQRFKEFNEPFNPYCSDNYIDYNYVVDRILTMSLPYVDVKKENHNNNETINNLNNNSYIIDEDNNKNIINNKDENKNDNGNDKNTNYINNNYINNNYINNNYINNNKININVGDSKNYNKQIVRPEPFTNIGQNTQNNLKINKNDKNDSSNNSSFNKLNLNDSNNNYFIKESNNKSKYIINNPLPQAVTANNLLHSLGNINRYLIAPGNSKLMLSSSLLSNMHSINNNTPIDYHENSYINLNKQNMINNQRPIEEDYAPKKMNSNLIMNAIQTPSQSSFIFQQKPSLMEINLFNRNNSSHIFDDEGETLKQILGVSSEKYFRSSMSFDSPKYSYGAHINNGNNNFTNINNNENSNAVEQKIGENKRKYNNEAAFRPLNIISNKNMGNNIITQNKIIYSDYGNKINYEKKNIESNNIKKDN